MLAWDLMSVSTLSVFQSYYEKASIRLKKVIYLTHVFRSSEEYSLRDSGQHYVDKFAENHDRQEVAGKPSHVPEEIGDQMQYILDIKVLLYLDSGSFINHPKKGGLATVGWLKLT